MRILQTHADFIEYEPIEKEIKTAESVEKKKQRLEDVLVLFTSVEVGDREETGRKAIDEVKDFLGKIKCGKILIYPFAHLSRELEKPAEALKIFLYMQKYADSLGIETHRAPFGWNKAMQIKIKGHPLAEQSKIFSDKKMSITTVKERVKHDMSLLKKSDFAGLPDTDHRVIGQKLDLFSFQEIAPGMVYMHPNGMVIFNELMNYSRQENLRSGYSEVRTPILANNVMWEVSGHWSHYKDNMFFTNIDEAGFAMKPMNCPNAIMIFKSTTRSYRDLPMRLMEYGSVNRNELSGVLSGLFRLRNFTQDDAHIFCTEDQLVGEIEGVVRMIQDFMKTFSFDYSVEFSTRPENSMGSDEVWNKAETAIEDSLKKLGVKYSINKGDGAFYGPKIDFHVKDSMGRSWQLSTVQIDFQMAERFGATYTDAGAKEKNPVIIHRAVYGAIERFMGVLTEHYQGKFPAWLSPIQAKVITISDENNGYGKKILETLLQRGIRAAGDFESATIGHKIREAQIRQVPYMVVVGKKEQEDGTIAVRNREGKTTYKVKLENFVSDLKKEIEEKR
jgi:threonyl-tRNA synthetase